MRPDEDERVETIDDGLARWRKGLAGVKSAGYSMTSAEQFILDLGQAYDQARDDYAELEIICSALEKKYEVSRAELAALRSRLRGMGGAA